MSKQIIVTEVEVKAALEAAKSQEVKDVLAALFCKPEKKPNLDDYKSIKSYEDACEALDLTPIYSDKAKRSICEHINGHWDYRQELPKHIMALLKLEVISRALWGRNWELSQMLRVITSCGTPGSLFGLRKRLRSVKISSMVPSCLRMRLLVRMLVSVL